MNTTFHAVNFTASPALQQLATDKVTKLFHQNDKIIRIDVALHQGAVHNPKNQFCEINVSLPGHNLFVKKRSDLYEKSMDNAVEALRKIMRRAKSKRTGVVKTKI